MKCTGKAKLFKMTVEKNRTVGQIYFATNVAKKGEEPVFENDFCNVVMVGKAHQMMKEFDELFDIEKMPIYITESQLRLKSGKREDGTYWNYNELVVFEFEEVEEAKPSKPSQSKNKKPYRR